jgi:putative DNA primase/helicase
MQDELTSSPLPRPVIEVREAALDYASRGWRVVPLQSREKKPTISDWVNAASADPTVIRGWFSEASDLNVGILTGQSVGLLVVDIDPRNGGDESLKRLMADIGDFPPTVTCLTGGEGLHFYFLPPPGEAKLRPNLDDYPGIDFKSSGQVVAPPSVHPNGRPYAWKAGCSPVEISLAPLPVALHSLLSAKSASPAARRSTPSIDGEITEGGRNDALFKRACSLRAKDLSPSEIRGAVQVLNAEWCSPPLEAAEVASLVDSALNYNSTSRYALTDLGNARRLVDDLNGAARYVAPSKKWLIFSGTHWRFDTDQEIMRLAKATVDRMLVEAKLVKDPGVRRALEKWARVSQSQSKLGAMVALALSEPGVPIAIDELDSHRHLLNVENGTIDLKTGELLVHQPGHFVTRVIPVAYDPEAKCPEWDRLNEDVADGKQDLPDFLRRIAGYGATGETREQCFFVLYGSGANGKSSWLNGVRGVLGPYAMQTPGETLLAQNNGSGIGNDLARLRGARFVTVSEIDEGRHMAVGLVKQATGGEPITSRFLYGEFFEFTPEFKFFLGTNHRPKLNGGDPAIWRRTRLIPFTRVVPPERQDRNLSAKIASEAQGILAWIVRGAQEWYEKGLQPPGVVTAATEDYRREMDVVGAFLEERTTKSAGSVLSSALYNAYRVWSVEEGCEPKTSNAFGRELGKRGHDVEKRGGVSYRLGISVFTPTELARS